MLSKANRFSLKTDRSRIEKEGKSLHTSLFTVLLAPRVSPDLPIRFSILVSKKTIPLSVDRHHYKRLISEVIRLHLSTFKSGQDVILIPKRTITTATSEQILADLQQSLKSD